MEQNINTAMPATSSSQQGSGNGLKIATAIASIVAICGIGFGVYGMIQSTQKDNQISDLRVQIKNSDGTITTIDTPKIETTTSDGSVITISDMPESVDQDSEVKQIVRTVYEALSTNIKGADIQTDFGVGSMIKIPGTNIYTIANRSYGVNLNMDIEERDFNAILDNASTYAKSALNSNGFVEEKEIMFGKLLYNSSNGISCLVGEANIPFRVSCSKNTWITDEQKEFVLALAKAAGTDYVSADPSRIADSQVSPHQKLTAFGENYAMLFYRTSPSSEWQFFKGTQDLIGCNKYTGDAAKAFAGDTCWDEATRQSSTVQP
ncbi:hypothetical protein J5868_01200 [Candidatus Saccharibacteria bacterium]|nr:hypothetical protein [Candidatus Saccharibacteria bacterium]